MSKTMRWIIMGAFMWGVSIEQLSRELKILVITLFASGVTLKYMPQKHMRAESNSRIKRSVEDAK